MVSRYHLAKQADGRGWMIIKLDALHTGFTKAKATVVECNQPEARARALLADYRSAEKSTAPLSNPPAPGGPR